MDFDGLSRTFRINGELVKSNKNYMVALNDFMLAGYDFRWLTEETEGIVKIHKPTNKEDVRSEIRKAIISYLIN